MVGNERRVGRRFRTAGPAAPDPVENMVGRRAEPHEGMLQTASFVSVVPGEMSAASVDLNRLAAALRQANAVAALPTTQIAAAAQDEVSAAMAALFDRVGADFQTLSLQTTLFHQRFAQAVNAAGLAYAGAEAAATSPQQTLEEGILAAIDAPTNLLLGRPLIGDGTNCGPGQAGGAGGLLWVTAALAERVRQPVRRAGQGAWQGCSATVERAGPVVSARTAVPADPPCCSAVVVPAASCGRWCRRGRRRWGSRRIAGRLRGSRRSRYGPDGRRRYRWSQRHRWRQPGAVRLGRRRRASAVKVSSQQEGTATTGGPDTTWAPQPQRTYRDADRGTVNGR